MTEKKRNVELILEEYRGEVHSLAAAFFHWKSISDQYNSDRVVRRKMDANAGFWKLTLHAYQVTFLCAIARLFDPDETCFTVFKFIHQCKKNLAEFKAPAWEARRRATFIDQMEPEWFRDRLAEHHATRPKDFDNMLEQAKSWVPNAQPFIQIRHKSVAHNDFKMFGIKKQLYTNARVGELEAIIRYLKQLELQVHMLYENGRYQDAHLYNVRDDWLAERDILALFTNIK